MQVPIMNVDGENDALSDELVSAIARVFKHGLLMLGPEVEQFENEAARRLGVRHAIGVNSGTDALVLAMRALDVRPGMEVITVPNSFVATAGAIRQMGAVPRFVDVGGDENMDPARLEEAIGPRTAAIIPVHLRGRPARMEEILKIAGKHGLPVIEDAAQAFGASLHGRAMGGIGRVGAISMHPQKVLGAVGDAGLVTTNDDALAERIRLLRHHGLRSRDEAGIWGQNSRLDSIQAAVLSVKLKYVDRWIERRRSIAQAYRERLQDLDVTLPVDGPGEYCVYYLFSIFTPVRDSLMRYLQDRGIDARVHYPIPIHCQPAAASDISVCAGGLPEAERQSREQLSLPIYPDLTEAQIEAVTDAVRAFFRGRLPLAAQ